jgi:hypothetical protein
MADIPLDEKFGGFVRHPARAALHVLSRGNRSHDDAESRESFGAKAARPELAARAADGSLHCLEQTMHGTPRAHLDRGVSHERALIALGHATSPAAR